MPIYACANFRVSVTKCEVSAIKSLMMSLLAPLGCQGSELMEGGGWAHIIQAAMVTEIAWRVAWREVELLW